MVWKPATSKVPVRKASTTTPLVHDDRRQRVLAAVEEMGLRPVQRREGDPQLCGACLQCRAQTNVFPNGLRHHTIRRGEEAMGGRKLWYPFVDTLEELEECMEARRIHPAGRYGRYNAKRQCIQ